MPGQMYLTADAAPYSPASFKGNWDDSASAITARLDSTKTTADLSKFTLQTAPVSEASAAQYYRVCCARFVGGPLLAQTISGTLQVYAGVWESDELAEFYYRIHAYVTQGDSDDVRGTLVNGYEERLESNNEWPTDPKGRNLMLSAAMNAVTCAEDDRIVVELGYVACNADATSFTGAIFYGTRYYGQPIPDMTRDP